MRGPDLSGEVIDDRYQVIERLAEGAMGVVYRGSRLHIDRAVAIKVMHASLPTAMEGRKRFEREAKVMAMLEHPHCVSIIDYGVHGAKPYVVMELVRGRDLHELIQEQGRFEIPRAVEVMRQVLSGLSHAHEHGIIHRDIKPANIMVTPKAPLGLHVRILDFGLARMLEATASVSNGVAVGTPSYMAPEQCRGDALDARVDIYACGVVLFEMLTGEKPFRASDPFAIVKKQIEETPPKLADVAPGNYGALEDIVARALSKSPLDRYPTAVAMAEALDAAVSGRVAPEPTMQFAPVRADTTMRAKPIPEDNASVEVPITVGSSIRTLPAGRAGALRATNNDSSVRRELPVSRMRWVVLLLLVLVGAGLGGVIMWQRELANQKPPGEDATETVVVVAEPPPTPVVDDAAQPEPEPVPVPVAVDAAVPLPAPPVVDTVAHDPAADLAAEATRLVAAGKEQAAIDGLVKARQVYKNSALLAVMLAKLYLNKMWWNDGLVHARDAVKLDPSLRNDQELLKLVMRGFIMTPGYDSRLASFLIELGPSAKALLEETARTHPNAEKRSRAQSLLRRMR